MSYVKRMLQLPTSRVQQLVELTIIAGLAFTLGVAANALGRGTGLMTAHEQRAAVAPAAPNRPPVTARSVSAPAPYQASEQLYDNGWAGGPNTLSWSRSAAAPSAPQASQQLYDNGWAGGPNTLSRTSSSAVLLRAPYEAGQQLYDNGWAGGPRTLSQSQISK